MGYEGGGGNAKGGWNSPGRGRGGGGFRGGNRGSSPGFRGRGGGFRGGNRGGGGFRGNSFNRDGGNRSFGRGGPNRSFGGDRPNRSFSGGDGVNRSFGGGDSGNRSFGGRGGGFRGGRGGNFRGGRGGNFNRNDSFSQNGTPQNRKRKFSEDDDGERPDFKKSNKDTSFFSSDDKEDFKKKTPSILKKDGLQSEKKNVKVFSDKKSPVGTKTPATPHPFKQQKGKFQPRKIVESDSGEDDEDDDEEETAEDSDDIELGDLKVNGKKPRDDEEEEEDEEAEDEEVEIEDEEESEEEEEEVEVTPAPKAAPKPGKPEKAKFSLDAVSHERSRRQEILSSSLFTPTDRKLNNVQVFKKAHPFVVDVWTVSTGTLILFDSANSRNVALKYLKDDKRFKLTQAQDVPGLLEEPVKNADPLKLKLSHLPSGCSQNDLKVLFPDACNVKLNGDWAVLSFNSHPEAVKAISSMKNIKIYGKPVLVAFHRDLKSDEPKSNGVDKKEIVKEKAASQKKALIESSGDEEDSGNEAEDEELAEDLEVEDLEDDELEIEDEDEEEDEGGQGNGLIDTMADEGEESDDIPSSEEGIEEVSDEEDD
ncbi:unnamed protein product [Bursaphelenchus xylophilus]|uniref:(pine wood nematode) hypothetical protein n=1 Tax=Bursaphelenchus xylophilus TaxID=6326 RepID=A0A1I7RH75_BURXY|nr:unnamed protein product [Bursaphelenchus xylophilus]CAG9115949.1 unnamed protein product [Bursaphelenchus xylophilus]